jgi:hypothetical protein
MLTPVARSFNPPDVRSTSAARLRLIFSREREFIEGSVDDKPPHQWTKDKTWLAVALPDTSLM